MMRSLFSAVSGLKTHQTRMDVIGNNIANVNTEAFKASSVRFLRIRGGCVNRYGWCQCQAGWSWCKHGIYHDQYYRGRFFRDNRIPV